MILRKPPEQAPIIDLQRMLRTIYPDSSLSTDGIFGKETQKEVLRFQRGNDLPQTGVVDLPTWEALRRVFQYEKVHNDRAEPLQIVLQSHQVLERGSDNAHMYLIQALLLALRRFYVDMPPLRVTGVLDEPTARALQWFQEKVGLPTSGEMDKHTWRHLANHYRLIIGDGTGAYPVRIAQQPMPKYEQVE